jgi:predicted AlkP superfamily phosphohydrolase/phosphomutase
MKRKLLIAGIDGGTWEVIHPLIEQGELPNLAALVRQGVHGSLRSTLPPQSAPAWVSLVTGQNPGRHGIFDFWARDLRQYDDASTQLNQATIFAGQTIWDYAGAAGLHVGVISVPVTYPAWPVNGFLISGTLLAPGMNQHAAYPSELAERYGLALNFPDGYRYGASREEVMREGPAMMLRRKDVVLELLAKYPCDFLMVVLGETDKAQHDFWRYLETDCPQEERERYGEVISDHYRVADQVLGEILDAFGRDAIVAVVSDHGAGPYPRRVFRTNAWLREQGWLTLRSRAGVLQLGLQTTIQQVKRFLPGRLQATIRRRADARLLSGLRDRYTGLHDLEWQATQAYRVPMQPPAEGIMINLQGRQPEGVVPPAEYETTVERIAEELSAFTDLETEKPVVAEIHRRDQIYSGPYVEERAPDLVLVMAPGYKGAWGNDLPVVAPVPAAELAQYRGTHTMDGIFILSGPGIHRDVRLEHFSILDVAPTLLHALGLPVPTNMDGRVLLETFKSTHAAAVRHAEPAETAVPPNSRLSGSEEQEIVERLRGLGYLE